MTVFAALVSAVVVCALWSVSHRVIVGLVVVFIRRGGRDGEPSRRAGNTPSTSSREHAVRRQSLRIVRGKIGGPCASDLLILGS